MDNVDGLNGVESVAVSPDGKHVYTASWLDSAVAAFSRKDPSGRLEFVEAVFHQITAHDGLLGASSVAVSPDGAHIYVGGRDDDAVVAFSRDAGSGQLTFIEAHLEGVGDVDGLWGVSAIALSPDGKYLYAAGETDSAIALFARDAVSGKPSFVEALFNGQGGLEGFAKPSSLAISPNGSHLHVATHVDPSRDDWIIAFSRNSATGKLEFVEAHSKDVVSGCDGLSISAASAIAMSLLGDHVFATTLDDAVAVFSRDPTTGKLTLIEEQCDGVAALIRQYTSMAASPDGMNLYVTSFMDDSLSEFQTPPAASLKLNYPTGQPGSFFTLTGQNFAADGKASIAVNQQVSLIRISFSCRLSCYPDRECHPLREQPVSPNNPLSCCPSDCSGWHRMRCSTPGSVSRFTPWCGTSQPCRSNKRAECPRLRATTQKMLSDAVRPRIEG